MDSGPVTLFLLEEPPNKIKNLFDSIKVKKIVPCIVPEVLVEIFKHLCVARGRYFAEKTLTSLIHTYNFEIVSILPSIIIKSGELKCRFRDKLSYVDCIAIAYSINNRLEFHTTEKELPPITNLKVVKYDF